MKREKQARKAALVDLNDFIMAYGAKKLPHESQLAEKIYAAGKDDLNGLDDLFQDNGLGRKDNYLSIATGFSTDLYDLEPQEAAAEGEKICKEAMEYLGAHTETFNKWQR